jgi:HNH endonuclease
MSKAVDLTDQRFGRLIAVRHAGKQGREWLWECHCDCGGVSRVLPGNLKSGRAQSCGCIRKENNRLVPRKRPRIELSGKRFGRLLVLGLSPKRCKGRDRMWLCRCECGEEVIVVQRSLRRGVSNSCGCLMRELSARRMTTHGMYDCRSAQKHGAVFVRFNKLDVFEEAGWRCYICGCDTPRELRGKMKANSPELDHIIPLARGGSHTRENAACACRRCNTRKWAHPLQMVKPQVAV